MANTDTYSHEEWWKERECIKCKVMFTLAASYGRQQCKEHPYDIFNGRFECCGIATSTKNRRTFYSKTSITSEMLGCIGSDHSDGSEDHGGFEIVPFSRYRGACLIEMALLGNPDVPPPLIVRTPKNEDEAKHYKVVVRFEKSAFNKKRKAYMDYIAKAPTAN